MKRLAFLPLCLIAGAALAQAPNVAPPPPPTAVATPGGHTDMADGNVTQALNLLEAQGFDNYTDFHAQGNLYVATVTSHGQRFRVTIDVANGRIMSGG
jgi:hypothetical protein